MVKRINKDSDLSILLNHGWESVRGGKNGTYFKILSSNNVTCVELIINPKESKEDFVIYVLTQTEAYSSSLIVDALEFYDEVFNEIELLKRFKILSN